MIHIGQYIEIFNNYAPVKDKLQETLCIFEVEKLNNRQKNMIIMFGNDKKDNKLALIYRMQLFSDRFGSDNKKV